MRTIIVLSSLIFLLLEVWTFFSPLYWKERLHERIKIDMVYMFWIILVVFYEPIYAVAYIVWSCLPSLYLMVCKQIKPSQEDPIASSRAKYSSRAIVLVDAGVSILMILALDAKMLGL